MVDQSVMEDHRNQTKLILERIRSAPSLRLCQSFADMEEIAEDLPLPKQLAYWAEMHEDARMAEQILGFDAESKMSWDQHIGQQRKRASDALREAGKMSVMLWEQLSEGEEFELNPERYWKTIITDALNLADAKRAPVYAYTGLAGGAAAPPDVLPSLRDRLEKYANGPQFFGWASIVCETLEEVRDQAEQVLADEILCGLAKKLISRAYADCEFAHCYLSVAEEADCALS